MNRFLPWAFVVAAVAIFPSTAPAQSGVPDPSLPAYRRGGFSSMMAMGRDLHRALPDGFRAKVYFRPFNLLTDLIPSLRPEILSYPDIPEPMAMVFASVGFVDLVNYVAHAKAIDEVQRGYFQRAIDQLAKLQATEPLPKLPNHDSPAHWTDDVMNVQESNFNQMTGILLATEISHHYLGHVAKYGSQLKAGEDRYVPINRLLTDQEWIASLKAGTLNALDCGFGVEGFIALLEAIEKMAPRPEWTVYFLPEKFQFRRIRRDLLRWQDNFFAGRR